MPKPPMEPMAAAPSGEAVELVAVAAASGVPVDSAALVVADPVDLTVADSSTGGAVAPPVTS
jgi:hypothetical protein